MDILIKSKETYKISDNITECIFYYDKDHKHIYMDYFIENDKINGCFTNYFDNGKIKIKCVYKNGKYHDNYIQYYENGEIFIDAFYDNGKVISYYQYDNLGKIIIKYQR